MSVGRSPFASGGVVGAAVLTLMAACGGSTPPPPPQPDGVRISPRSVRVVQGVDTTVAFMVIDQYGDTLPTRPFKPLWETEDSATATVDQAGTVTGTAPGNTRVSVQIERDVPSGDTVVVEQLSDAVDIVVIPPFSLDVTIPPVGLLDQNDQTELWECRYEIKATGSGGLGPTDLAVWQTGNIQFVDHATGRRSDLPLTQDDLIARFGSDQVGSNETVSTGGRVAEFHTQPFSVLFELRYSVGEENRAESRTMRCNLGDDRGPDGR